MILKHSPSSSTLFCRQFSALLSSTRPELICNSEKIQNQQHSNLNILLELSETNAKIIGPEIFPLNGLEWFSEFLSFESRLRDRCDDVAQVAREVEREKLSQFTTKLIISFTTLSQLSLHTPGTEWKSNFAQVVDVAASASSSKTLPANRQQAETTRLCEKNTEKCWMEKNFSRGCAKLLLTQSGVVRCLAKHKTLKQIVFKTSLWLLCVVICYEHLISLHNSHFLS